jgi:hypothetical protein
LNSKIVKIALKGISLSTGITRKFKERNLEDQTILPLAPGIPAVPMSPLRPPSPFSPFVPRKKEFKYTTIEICFVIYYLK